MGLYYRWVFFNFMLALSNVLWTEGLVTCVVSAALYFLISDFPEEVKFLNTEEKAFVKQRLYEDVGDSDHGRHVSFKDVLSVFKDCKPYLTPRH